MVILSGQLDLCQLSCFRRSYNASCDPGNTSCLERGRMTAQEFGGNLKAALDILRGDMPKTFVAIVKPMGEPMLYALTVLPFIDF